MKQFIAIITLTFFTHAAFSQTPVPFPKTIHVTGTAEMDVIPDEIYVIVTLKEYEKKGSGKIDLETIKNNFLNSCRNIGLPDSVISIASYEGAAPEWWKKKKKEELYATIAYQVKFSSSKKMDELVNLLDDNATQNFEINRVSNSKIQEYRKQIKIQAIKAAKAKAVYLTEAIDEKLGTAITITETNNNAVPLYMYSRQQFSNTLLRDGGSADTEGGIDFKKIKISMEIDVVFALQ